MIDKSKRRADEHVRRLLSKKYREGLYSTALYDASVYNICSICSISFSFPFSIYNHILPTLTITFLQAFVYNLCNLIPRSKTSQQLPSTFVLGTVLRICCDHKFYVHNTGKSLPRTQRIFEVLGKS